MKRMVAAALCLMACRALPAVAGDYVLKLEMTTEVESKLGDGKPVKTSDVRMLEILIVPELRFHGKTTWENQRLTVKGKMTEEKDGKLRLDIRCEHAVKTVATERIGDGNSGPDNELRSRVNTTVAVKPGDPLVIAGLISSQTNTARPSDLDEARITFRVTVVEGDDDES